MKFSPAWIAKTAELVKLPLQHMIRKLIDIHLLEKSREKKKKKKKKKTRDYH